ncbi:MAG: SDR family NAD(P)-dependent oxidoreductase [Fibrobacteria bacterium]|nr:SDR family NAD(P)-dependent oxidoreductase [Fibrobacteria bacterium]
MELKNAKILITGGSSGIGKATASLLAETGAKVAITGRDPGKLNKAADEMGAIAIDLDQSRYDDIPEKLQTAVSELGGLDVLVNNAGVGVFPSMGELTAEKFEQVFSVNVFGLALLTQEAVKIFKEQNSGNIVNIASTAATKGFPTGSIYGASKFALRGMTLCWQTELRKHNIRVMLINPSEVPTAFAREDRAERPVTDGKLTSVEIAHAIKSALEMDNRGFIPELSVWATNP